MTFPRYRVALIPFAAIAAVTTLIALFTLTGPIAAAGAWYVDTNTGNDSKDCLGPDAPVDWESPRDERIFLGTFATINNRIL